MKVASARQLWRSFAAEQKEAADSLAKLREAADGLREDAAQISKEVAELIRSLPTAD
jgi:uncharacterized coiled-coil DUF342 family protein